ncbi:MAG: ribonuclease P protein component [Oligoflexia bacterium]|nr:ribonuclease P protein component [Oligoflexia bacterium]
MSSKGKLSFPPSARIRRKAEFERVQSLGKRHASTHFVILFAPAPAGESRLGTIISKKVDKRAARRNRLRRRLREIFRSNRAKLTKIVDLVIIARREATELEFCEVEQELNRSLLKIRLLETV